MVLINQSGNPNQTKQNQIDHSPRARTQSIAPTERLAAVENVRAAAARQEHLEGRLVAGADAQGRVGLRTGVGLAHARTQHAELEALHAPHAPAAEGRLRRGCGDGDFVDVGRLM